jgi:uncharacterized protein YcbK (DUF882 family)
MSDKGGGALVRKSASSSWQRIGPPVANLGAQGINLFESEQSVQSSSLGWTRFPLVLVALLCLGVTNAFAETRSLKIHHLHTGEKAEIVFKRNGRYDQAGLKKINFILRDWRRNEPINMDPRLLDLVWQTYRASGSKAYINVVSGYRAPATNAMLRSRSKGVARKSQHMVGKAMDFFLPDVPLKKLRDIGLKMQAGGVGYYPTSGSPFIHLDVGNVRHWPGISRRELAGLFPDGKTLHVPSDGKPLPGYADALAAYKSRQASGAPAVALASLGGNQGKKRGLLTALFGGGADEADDIADVASAAPVPRKAVKAAPVPKVEEPAPRPGIAIVSPDRAQRTEIPMVVEEAPATALETKPEPADSIVATLSGSAVPLPEFAPRRTAEANIPTPETVPFGMANAAPAPVETALAGPVPTAATLVKSDATQPAVPLDRLAINIPLPTKRPDYQVNPVVPPEEPKSFDAIQALVAMNQSDDELDRLSGQPVSQPASADPVRTNPKTRRVEPRDKQPATAPVVVTASLQASHWPLEIDRGVTGAIATAKAPRLSADIMRTAPVQAYVEGFKAGRAPVDHQRFTGTAVNFLPIASFE